MNDYVFRPTYRNSMEEIGERIVNVTVIYPAYFVYGVGYGIAMTAGYSGLSVLWAGVGIIGLVIAPFDFCINGSDFPVTMSVTEGISELVKNGISQCMS